MEALWEKKKTGRKTVVRSRQHSNEREDSGSNDTHDSKEKDE